MSKFLNRSQVQKIFEHFNPVLDGNVIDGLNNNINLNAFNDFCDRPQYLEVDDCEPKYSDVGEFIPRREYSIGAFFINGKPLSDFSARFLNQPGYVDRSHQLNNLIDLYKVLDDRINKTTRKLKSNIVSDFEIIQVTNVKIVKIENSNNNIHLHVVFDLNEYTNIWSVFKNINTYNIEFICSEIESELSKEEKLKVKGILLQKLNNFFKIETGHYTFIGKEFFTYTQFGQIEKLKESEIIEVIKVNSDTITFRKVDKIYIIKKPDYYYFNWFFTKK